MDISPAKHFDFVKSKCSLMKGERNESQSVCSSVCSCSSSTSLLSLDCCDQSANSSSNRKNRKRKIIDMPPRKSGVISDPLYSEMVNQGIAMSGDEWKKRVAMREIWTQNKDAYLHHLQRAQAGAYGSRNNEMFWELFTREFVRRQKLDIQISEELIESCKSYGLYLQELGLQCKVYNTRMESIVTLQAHRESKDTRNVLFDIFAKDKLKLKRGTSTRPSGATPPSGKLSRSSDPTVQMTYPVMKEKVNHTLADMVTDGLLKEAPSHLMKFRDYIQSDELLALIFLKESDDQRITRIAEFLGTNK